MTGRHAAPAPETPEDGTLRVYGYPWGLFRRYVDARIVAALIEHERGAGQGKRRIVRRWRRPILGGPLMLSRIVIMRGEHRA